MMIVKIFSFFFLFFLIICILLIFLVRKLFFFIFAFYFLICQLLFFYFISLFIKILFLSLFSILIAYISRFFPFFILFSSKTYIFYYDNAGSPYSCSPTAASVAPRCTRLCSLMLHLKSKGTPWPNSWIK